MHVHRVLSFALTCTVGNHNCWTQLQGHVLSKKVWTNICTWVSSCGHTCTVGHTKCILPAGMVFPAWLPNVCNCCGDTPTLSPGTAVGAAADDRDAANSSNSHALVSDPSDEHCMTRLLWLAQDASRRGSYGSKQRTWPDSAGSREALLKTWVVAQDASGRGSYGRHKHTGTNSAGSRQVALETQIQSTSDYLMRTLWMCICKRWANTAQRHGQG